MAAAGDSSFALGADRTVWASGANGSGQLGTGTTTDLPSPIRVDALTDITSLSVTSTSGVAVQADGTVCTWGDPRSPDTAITVSALLGGAIAADGTVWVWAFSLSGTTAKPPIQVDDLSDAVALAMRGESNLALKADGTVWE